MTYQNYRFSIIERLEAKSKLQSNGCIEYASTKHKYGLVSITLDGKRKSVPAHRAMYMAMNDCLGLPSNVHIRHKCDNPRCMNVEHLEPGTPKDNMQDCIERGRRAKAYVYAQRLREHDTAKVEAIRNATGKYKHIAQEHGVSVGYVSKLKRGRLKK